MNNSIEMRDNSHSREPILVDFSDNVSISSKNSGYKIMKPFHIYITTIKKCKIFREKLLGGILSKAQKLLIIFIFADPFTSFLIMLSITIVITGIGIGFSFKSSENSDQMDTTTQRTTTTQKPASSGQHSILTTYLLIIELQLLVK